MKKYEIGSDDDDLTVEQIDALPDAEPDEDEEIRPFRDAFYQAAYDAGYETFASYSNGDCAAAAEQVGAEVFDVAGVLLQVLINAGVLIGQLRRNSNIQIAHRKHCPKRLRDGSRQRHVWHHKIKQNADLNGHPIAIWGGMKPGLPIATHQSWNAGSKCRRRYRQDDGLYRFSPAPPHGSRARARRPIARSRAPH